MFPESAAVLFESDRRILLKRFPSWPSMWCETTTSKCSLPPERGLDLAAALRALPARQRAAVALHDYEDRSAEEIGVLLGCSTSTVRTHLLRARARLAEVLADDEVAHVE